MCGKPCHPDVMGIICTDFTLLVFFHNEKTSSCTKRLWREDVVVQDVLVHDGAQGNGRCYNLV